jgi:hypothetical protein
MATARPIRSAAPADLPGAPTTVRPEHAAAVGVSLRLTGGGPSNVCQPFRAGVPLPRGAMHDPARLVLLNPAGARTPLQSRVLARWPDGSVRWLLLDFLAQPTDNAGAGWELTEAGSAPAPEAPTLRLDDSGPTIRVDTGAACFHFARTDPAGFRVLVEHREVVRPSGPLIGFTDRNGKVLRPELEHVIVEERGPVRATVRWEGTFDSRPSCRFVARFDVFAGTGLCRVELTLHNPHRARHTGGLWDLGDAGSLLFRELALHTELPDAATPAVTWTPEPGQPPLSVDGDLELYQDSSGGENWRSKNHLNRDGQVPLSFRGYRVRAGAGERHGLRASPVVTARGPNGAVTIAIPEFWQQFPKAVAVEGTRLRVGLFPGQFGDLFELQGGEQKSHVVWFHLAASGASPASLAWVHQPARITVEPEWYARSGVFPYLTASPEPLGTPADDLFDAAVHGPHRLAANRETIDEYGWRNYGEVYADHEAAYYRGPLPLISHYNNQYDLLFGCLLQWFRTGDPAWFDLADPLARHVRDIDIYRTTEDRAAYSGGLFWHTDHYRDAATSTHRTFSRANGGDRGASYGGGPANEHNYTTGLVHYHYLTGDPAARDVVLWLANWVIDRDDGRRTILGLVDDGPTGLASATAEPDYHGPGRGAGNSVNALLDAWLLTDQPHYLDKAESLIRRSIHPADDVEAHHLLEVERRWSYTVFLSVLARYLEAKADAGQVDAQYAYARASLLHYARWMLDHEVPYFDRPEQLEYPTETWAAQELRKGNVLRLAAAHADEPLRSRLRGRGEQLADRAWKDLMAFPSRHVARSLAIALREGPVDAFLRRHDAPAPPRPAGVYDFGRPETFMPQKARVKRQLRSVRGLARGLVHLGDPRRWWRLWKRP